MRAGSGMSSGLSPRVSDLRPSEISGPRRRLSPLEPGPRAPTGCPLTTRSRTAYTLNLHQKLTWEAYIVHLTAWPSCPRSTSGARPFTAEVSRPRRNRDQGDGVGRKDQADGPQATAAVSGVNLA